MRNIESIVIKEIIKNVYNHNQNVYFTFLREAFNFTILLGIPLYLNIIICITYIRIPNDQINNEKA